uniref:Uncharacterized protein n=1 Tax=Arundo donax TaxID=35708 RepID=A0A0A9FDB3_ARUDO
MWKISHLSSSKTGCIESAYRKISQLSSSKTGCMESAYRISSLRKGQ